MSQGSALWRSDRLAVLNNPASLGALVAAATATTVQDESSVRFTLLSVMLVLTSLMRLSTALAAAITVSSVAAAFLGAIDAYSSIWWLDDVAHFAVTGVLALGAVVSVGQRLVSNMRLPVNLEAVPLVFGIGSLICGLVFASAWEIYEWLVVKYLDAGNVHTSPPDTIMDIALGGTGSLLAGVLVATQVTRSRLTSTNHAANLFPVTGNASPIVDQPERIS